MASGSVLDVEIRDTPLHRAFADPRSVESERRTSNRYYGNCQTPVVLPYRQKIPDGAGGHFSVGSAMQDHEIHVPCRNCMPCLRARRFQWGMRCHVEILKAPRNWFFTGTFRNQGHDYVESKEEVQRFLKRLRYYADQKVAAGKCQPQDAWVRYLMLPELHKSGAIHYHGIIHHGGSITERMVRKAWQAGFCWPSEVRQAEATAHYVTKYCTKDMVSDLQDERGKSRRPRILASRNPTYGDEAVIRDAELVQALAEMGKKELQELWQTNVKQALRMLEAKEPTSAHRRVIDHLTAKG